MLKSLTFQAFKSNEHRFLYYGLKKCDGRCFRIHCSADTSLKPKLRLSIGSANVPHPDKASYGGEDAYFVSSSGGGAMGVADGVGGWIESGINPAEYSITFMEMAKRYLEGGLDDFTGEETTPLGSLWWLDHSPSPDPIGASEVERNLPDPSVKAVEALAVAHKLTRKPGSATACVLRLVQESAELEAANVGDSGFIIIRDGEILFQSPPLQHFFDCPYQFADAPNNAPATDNAGDAQVFRIELRHGDVIILATDGLFDNVWPKDMVRSVPSCPEEVQEYAELLAHLASANGADETFESPYSVQAAAQGIDLPVWEKLTKIAFVGGKLELGRIRGGKLDDVTVLTAYVETVPV